MIPIKPDPHAEVERLAPQIVEQTLYIHELENGKEKHRWTNVGFISASAVRRPAT